MKNYPASEHWLQSVTFCAPPISCESGSPLTQLLKHYYLHSLSMEATPGCQYTGDQLLLLSFSLPCQTWIRSGFVTLPAPSGSFYDWTARSANASPKETSFFFLNRSFLCGEQHSLSSQTATGSLENHGGGQLALQSITHEIAFPVSSTLPALGFFPGLRWTLRYCTLFPILVITANSQPSGAVSGKMAELPTMMHKGNTRSYIQKTCTKTTSLQGRAHFYQQQTENVEHFIWWIRYESSAQTHNIVTFLLLLLIRWRHIFQHHWPVKPSSYSIYLRAVMVCAQYRFWI